MGTLVSIDQFPTRQLGTTNNSIAAAALPEDNRNDDTTTSSFDIATFSMGCFWGVELAFMRTRGVVGTRVGYSNGIVVNPSYAAIKEGNTHHRESVLVIYDARITSYHEILTVYKERFAISSIEYGSSPLIQYKHGIYFHTNTQKEQAHDFIA